MEESGNEFAGRFCDVEGLSVELYGVVVVDLARCAQGKMQVEQGMLRARGNGKFAGGKSLFINTTRDQTRGSEAGIIASLDFHLEDLVGGQVVIGFCVAQKGDHAVLESAEASFNFTFCLGSGSDAMGDAEAKQGALELATRIAVVVEGTPQQQSGAQPPAATTPKAKIFYGSADVPPATAKIRLVQIAEEIIAVLSNDPNATVKVTVEISAEFHVSQTRLGARDDPAASASCGGADVFDDLLSGVDE